MRILVFSWRDPKHPLAGGAEQVMHEHMKGWVKEGHQVTLFSSRFKNSLAEEGIDGIHIVRRGHQYLGVQLAGFWYFLKNRDFYDLVIDQFHGLPFFTPLYVKKPKLAVIQETAREVWFFNPLPWPFNWLIGCLGFMTEPLIFQFYRDVPFMTGSQSAKDDIIKFGIPQRNITIIPHGVIIKKPQPFPSKEKESTIVYLGILSKDKGIEDALECFFLLLKKVNFQFWIIGRPERKEYSKQVEKIVKKLSLEEKIKFWGFVSQNKKFELLARSHFLINPSLREGWGLVNIEANSMGTPVVAYQSPGLIDSVKNGTSGIICEENTPLSLAENIMMILGNKKKFRKLQQGAKIWSQYFSWEKSRQVSLNLIKQIAPL